MHWLSVLLILSAVFCLECIKLDQPAVMVVKPGESFTIPCKITGYSASGGGYTNWIRHSSGRTMEWIGWFHNSDSKGAKDSLINKISFSADSSSNTVLLKGKNFNTEDTAVYYCARNEYYDAFDYWGKGTQVTVSSAQPSAPQYLFGMVQCGSDSDGFLTLGCVARGFSPADSLSFKWTDPLGKPVNDFVQYPAVVQGRDNTKISHLRVKKSVMDPNNSYKCEAANSVGDIKTNVVPAANRVTKPNITLLSRADGETILIECQVNNYYPDKLTVKWFKNEQPISTSLPNKKLQNSDGKEKTFTFMSQLPISVRDRGTLYTCIATHNSVNITQSYNMCRDLPKPVIHLKKPHLRDIMKGGEVTTTCVVEAPHNTQVSWLVNGTSEKATSENKKDLSTTITQIVSNMTFSKEDGVSLMTIVCKAKHPCFQEEKAAIEAETILKDPVVVIRRPFTESESAVLECVVRDLPSSEVCITLQANDIDISEINCVDVNQSEKIQSLTTDFTIPKEQQKKDKTFTCTVRGLSRSWTSKPTGNIFGDPTVELSVVPNVSGSSSNPNKLVCSGTGFDPKITWVPNSEMKTGPVVTVGENGCVKVYSEILVSQQEWNQGVTFTCEITDQLNAKTIHTNISICAVNERSSQLADVYLLGPSLSDVRSRTDVILTCLVIGHRVQDFTVQWKTDTSNSNLYHNTQPPQDHANGTQSIQSTLKVPVRTWNAYSVFTCEVKPLCSGHTQKKHISKTRDPKRPSVRIFKPSDSDLSGSQNASLLCMITGFFPSEISVHWQLNGMQLDASQVTNSPAVSHIGSEGYSIYSALILPASHSKEDIYSCIVSHESSQNPIIATLENLYASLTHTAPTAKLLQGSNELVCLAFGFSPSAINITWLLGLTDMSGHRVTSPAEGPDGKFSIRSHLHLLPTNWAPGEVYSCRVTHITGVLLLNISKPEIFQEAIFMNENKGESIAQESLEEAWKMACSFLILFLLSLFYGCTVTLVKMKTT